MRVENINSIKEAGLPLSTLKSEEMDIVGMKAALGALPVEGGILNAEASATAETSPGIIRGLIGFLARGIKRFNHRRQARQMLAWDNHMLKDVGITRADLYREINKPFWMI